MASTYKRRMTYVEAKFELEMQLATDATTIMREEMLLLKKAKQCIDRAFRHIQPNLCYISDTEFGAIYQVCIEVRDVPILIRGYANTESAPSDDDGFHRLFDTGDLNASQLKHLKKHAKSNLMIFLSRLYFDYIDNQLNPLPLKMIKAAKPFYE